MFHCSRTYNSSEKGELYATFHSPYHIYLGEKNYIKEAMETESGHDMTHG